MKKIQFCCGNTPLAGWENHDMDIDISKTLPFTSATIDYIYCEHGIEHITQKEVWGFLDECNRILVRGGKIRLSFPDVFQITLSDSREYNSFITGLAEKMGMPFKKSISLKETIRTMVCGLNHKSTWTSGLMRAFLEGAGFVYVTPCRINDSPDRELANVEQHYKLVDIGLPMYTIETAILEGTKV
jgi:predicted SAM-dependent methyltransferase